MNVKDHFIYDIYLMNHSLLWVLINSHLFGLVRFDSVRFKTFKKLDRFDSIRFVTFSVRSGSVPKKHEPISSLVPIDHVHPHNILQNIYGCIYTSNSEKMF